MKYARIRGRKRASRRIRSGVHTNRIIRSIASITVFGAVLALTVKLSASVSAGKYDFIADAGKIVSIELAHDVPIINPDDILYGNWVIPPEQVTQTDDNTGIRETYEDQNDENVQAVTAEPPHTAIETVPDEGLYYNGFTGRELQDGTRDVDNSAPIIDDSLVLVNSSGLEPDIAELLCEPLDFSLRGDDPVILIIHTHSSEAYTPTEQYPYEESDPYRNQEPDRNIIAVGTEITKMLEENGVNVIHDTGVYDYPSYSGSYGRTLDKVQEYIEKYPTIKCVLDVHRDASDLAGGKQFRTNAKVDGVTMSQVLFYVGTNAELEHPNWKENLKFALRLTHEMNRCYPSLSRPIRLSRYRYNQHLCPNYVIVEVGAAGNTLEESLLAADYFTRCLLNLGLS